MSAWIVSKEHIDFMIAAGLGMFHAPQYPGDGFGHVSWYDTEPESTWTFAELAEHWHELRRDTADAVGRMLWWECVRSVAYRYEDTDLADLPGHGNTLEEYEGYRFVYPDPVDDLGAAVVSVLKQVACYEYQSCEHPDWEASEARRFCDALRHVMIGELPGYEGAPWGIEPAQATS